MKFISLARTIKFGFKNFYRNGWLSFATTLIMILTLFFVSSLIILNILLGLAISSVKEKIDISIYFKSEINEKEIIGLQNELRAMPEIKSIDVVSKEKATEIFKEKHKDNPLISSLLAELEENPFQVSMIIKAKNPEDYAALSKFLSKSKYKKIIEKVTFESNKEVIQKIDKVSKSVQKSGTILGLFFSLMAIVFLFNTIRMTIYTQREEIKIMRLWGATNFFIRLPYVVEAILYGVFGSLINTALLYFSLKYMSPRFLQFIGSPSLDLFFYFISHLWQILLLQILFASLLSIFSSLIATWRYLRV